MQTRLTEKLLGFLYSALNKSPERFVAFRAQHTSGTFRYSILNYAFTCYVNDVAVLSGNLQDYTVLSFAEALGRLNGMSIVYRAGPEVMGLSACVLLDGTGKQAESNGDCFYAYDSPLWAYMESVGKELGEAELSIAAMLDQMSLQTADDYWLDYWGEHFGVARSDGERDADYSKRIVIEVLRPRGNNKAIEAAILERFAQKATVVDVPMYRNQTNTFNGAYFFNGAPHYYNATEDVYYGLFNVVAAYDLLGSESPTAFATEVRKFVEKFRDAGTQMLSLNMSAPVISDQYPWAETDSHALALSAVLADTLTAPSESFPAAALSLAQLSDTDSPGSEATTATLTTSTTYNSQRYFNSLVRYQSGTGLADTWS